MKTPTPLALLAGAFMFITAPARGQEKFTTLDGSKAKVESAHKYAVQSDCTFMRDAAQVEKFARLGLLVKLTGNENYTLHGVSFPYVRPAGKVLIERLSAQYHRATGKTLQVNSTVRTLSQRFWNSSPKSVHPAGVAIDFAVPQDANAKKWLEDAFLTMQARGVVLATRERNPPHFHIVVLSKEYESYVAQKK